MDREQQIRTLKAIRAWSAETAEIASAKVAEIDNYVATGQPEDFNPTYTLPPCPVCGAEVKKTRHLRLDYGVRYQPCGCDLSIESWQTSLTRQCASAGIILFAVAAILGLLAGAQADTAVDVGFKTAFALLGAAIAALFLPRRRFPRPPRKAR